MTVARSCVASAISNGRGLIQELADQHPLRRREPSRLAGPRGPGGSRRDDGPAADRISAPRGVDRDHARRRRQAHATVPRFRGSGRETQCSAGRAQLRDGAADRALRGAPTQIFLAPPTPINRPSGGCTQPNRSTISIAGPQRQRMARGRADAARRKRASARSAAGRRLARPTARRPRRADDRRIAQCRRGRQARGGRLPRTADQPRALSGTAVKDGAGRRRRRRASARPHTSSATEGVH